MEEVIQEVIFVGVKKNQIKKKFLVKMTFCLGHHII